MRAGTVDTAWSCAELGGRAPGGTRCRPIPTGRAGPCSPIAATVTSTRHPPTVYAVLNAARRQARLVLGRVALGHPRASSTSSSAASACAAAGATRTCCASATRSTSGGSRLLEPDARVPAARRDEAARRGVARVAHRARRRGQPRLPARAASTHAGSGVACYWFSVAPFHRFVFPACSPASPVTPRRTPTRRRRQSTACSEPRCIHDMTVPTKRSGCSIIGTWPQPSSST